MPRILVVEDEVNVGSTLVERLEKEKFAGSDSIVKWCMNKSDAIREITQKDRHALAILDVGLPDGTGFEIAEKLRETAPQTAIIFLTAFGSPEDRIRGLELGADDYIVKPFHLKELILRIHNVLKRAVFVNEPSANDSVQIGKATIRFSAFEAEVDSEKHTLTHKECALLKLLFSNKGKVVSRDEILDRVWSEDEFPSPRTIDNFIMRLRRLVETDPENPQVLKSVRGVGYQLI